MADRLNGYLRPDYTRDDYWQSDAGPKPLGRDEVWRRLNALPPEVLAQVLIRVVPERQHWMLLEVADEVTTQIGGQAMRAAGVEGIVSAETSTPEARPDGIA